MASKKFENKTALLVAMERTAKRKVKSFFTDFTDYDVNTITEAEGGSAFIWLLRNSGTYLFAAESYDGIQAVLETWGTAEQAAYKIGIRRDGACTMEKADAAALLKSVKREQREAVNLAA